MFLSRLKPDFVNIYHANKAAFDNQYREHQVIWKLFAIDPNQERDFLFRFILEQNLPTYYILSKRPPVNSPEGWKLEGPREYDPRIKNGMHFEFSLRVNPVVTKKDPGNPDDQKKRKRHDVVMNLRQKWKDSGKPKDEWPTNMQMVVQAGSEWIQERQETFGFSVLANHLLVEGYTRMHFGKKDNSKAVQLGVLDYGGILEVTDRNSFQNSLFNGIGHSKAFGCGLLLIKPIK